MPGDPNECREHAKNCYRLAAEANTQEAKERFEKLAHTWMVLATDLEAAKSLIEAWGDPIRYHSAMPMSQAPGRASQ